jgi:hypothetical protein
MTPRRVLLRIKKLRKFLDGRIREWRNARDGAEDEESRHRAAARVEAYQDVREEMLDERLAVEEEGDEAGGDPEEPEG